MPQAGTLENPPGSSTREEGPAWELPEIKAFLDAFECQLLTTTPVHTKVTNVSGGSNQVASQDVFWTLRR